MYFKIQNCLQCVREDNSFVFTLEMPWMVGDVMSLNFYLNKKRLYLTSLLIKRIIIVSLYMHKKAKHFYFVNVRVLDHCRWCCRVYTNFFPSRLQWRKQILANLIYFRHTYVAFKIWQISFDTHISVSIIAFEKCTKGIT